jgi:hypothetical protein
MRRLRGLMIPINTSFPKPARWKRCVPRAFPLRRKLDLKPFLKAGWSDLRSQSISFRPVIRPHPMKYFSDFSISYRRGNLSMARGSGLKPTKGVLKTGWSDLNPHRGANIIAGGTQHSSPVEVANPNKPSKGAMIKGWHVLSGPDDSSTLTCAALYSWLLFCAHPNFL